MDEWTVIQFLEDFTTWAHRQTLILAAALVGSYARNEAKVDSDIDLIILTQDPENYLANLAWLSDFGEIDRKQIERYGRVTSLRVWYQNGLEIEFGITNIDWAGLPLDEGTRQVISDGMIILVDKCNILGKIQ